MNGGGGGGILCLGYRPNDILLGSTWRFGSTFESTRPLYTPSNPLLYKANINETTPLLGTISHKKSVDPSGASLWSAGIKERVVLAV